jgi:hypothetical protein
MIAIWMFVSVVCISNRCDFTVSDYPLPEAQCLEIKQQFAMLPFRPEVTLAASQCIKVKPGDKV